MLRVPGYLFPRLFLSSLVAALPVVAIFAWTLLDEVQQSRQAATASVLAHSTDIARRVDATLLRLNVVADVLLARDEVARMDSERCGEGLRDLPRVDPLILNVGLFDREGRALCLSRKLEVMPPTFRNTAWFREAMVHDRRVFTAPYFSPASKRLVLSMASPVRDGNGQRIGILGMSIDLERLSASLHAERLPPDAAVALMAANGTIVARLPDPPRWIGKSTTEAVMQATAGAASRATFDAVGGDGVLRTIGYAAVGSEGWRVYTGVPAEHFDALMHQSSERALMVLTAALLLVALASWAGARWLAEPLQRLTLTVRRLAAGDESAVADENLPGEAGQLGAEFNHMVRSLVAARNVERMSNERFMRLFSVIPVAAAVVDAQDGRLLEVNDTFCRQHGIAHDAALGRRLAEVGLVLPEPEAAELDRRLRAAEEVRGFEATVRDSASRERSVLLSAEPIDWGGRPSALTVQVDLTEQREIERQRQESARLQAANAAKTEFLSRMSHELRTPMNAILGFTQLLRRNPDGRLGENQLRQLGLVEQAGRQLTALIEDVLDVSRIEAGQLQLTLTSLDLRTFADEARHLSEGAARDAGVRLLPLRTDAGPLQVQADPTRLRQVLTNLLSNAIKYNRVGGEVELWLTRDEPWVQLEVRDTGIGMSERQLTALFEPFNRLGREQSRVSGTGIGLVLTRQLVRLQGGTLEVESVEDRGTTVRLRLPATSIQTTRPESPTADAASQSPAPRGRVLYIEDNPINSLVVEELLQTWPDVSLTLAADGRSGLARLRELRPDVVLLDMQLPDMSGIEVLRRIRTDPQTRKLPVICLSASAMPYEVEAARAAGADDFWAKPFDFETFTSGLRARLRTGQAPASEHASEIAREARDR